MKLIKIETCHTCPFRAAGPAIADISYVPRCNKEGKELPYVLGKSTRTPTAAPTNEIPEWCPLEDSKPAPLPERMIMRNTTLIHFTALLDSYTSLINSGDCGSWDPETEPVVIAARAAVVALQCAPPAIGNKEMARQLVREAASYDKEATAIEAQVLDSKCP